MTGFTCGVWPARRGRGLIAVVVDENGTAQSPGREAVRGGLRRRDARRERALIASLSEPGQPTPVVVARGEGERHVRSLLKAFARPRAALSWFQPLDRQMPLR